MNNSAATSRLVPPSDDEPGDPCLLWSHVWLVSTLRFRGLLTYCFQLGTGPSGKAVGSHLDEHVMSSAQLDVEPRAGDAGVATTLRREGGSVRAQ